MNGKLREARTLGERLAAILLMAVNKNEATNAKARERGQQTEHIMAAGDFLEIVQPFLDLSEVNAEIAHNTAGKVISLALLEKAKMDATVRQSSALFAIAEIIRKLELTEPEKAAGQ